MFSLLLLVLERIPLYLDPTQSVNDRIDDLMSRMTLEERIGQLVIPDGRFSFDDIFEKQHPGATFYLFDEDAAKVTMKARESRLKIPLLMGIDAIHGNSFYKGSTIFPTQLGMSSSWDPEIAEEAARVTAEEMNNTGPFWTFSPVLCVTRDLRWGRVDETFGEDQLLIKSFADAMIRGYQNNGVLATAKHYAGYSETLGGLDASEADLSHRKLLSYFLPSFESAAKNGAGSFMSGYSGIEGIPTVMNEWLLNDVLRGDWKYDGFVVSDYRTVENIVDLQNVFDNYEDAAVASLIAGNDMFMASNHFFDACLSAINKGKLDEKYVNLSCRRILKAKFDLGLFENDRIANKSLVSIGTPEHRQVALRAAEESLILLKNTGTLPLKESRISTIAVIGPNADHPLAQLGDWSLGSDQGMDGGHPRNCTVTILDGIKNRFTGGKVVYAKGAGIEPNEHENIQEAVDLVKSADVAVVVIGDREIYTGEGKSTATLELMGEQKALLEALIDTKKPLIINLIASKPIILPTSVVESADAIIAQFNPGMLGGTAFAEVLFGDISPSGKLTVSYPRHAGQLPLFYNYVRGQHGDHYADMTEAPLYYFGHGLSYSKFRYSSISTDKKNYTLGTDEEITISLKLYNYGSMDATEIVQVYLIDTIASVTWANRELKAFQRVQLKKGETKEVTLKIKLSDCSIVDADGKRVVEPGEFELHVGSNSHEAKSKLKIYIQ
ncbi:hypothetical protein M9Y10_014293 [Tritrichomonas musculus]|uniref:beta-glucosidase n=1 Tax=Tritrichomonas musculus TaxID=1915356 RepID=A0ABR2KZ46_9EUKA